MDTFASLDEVVTVFVELGADRIFFKQLQENDNSKQQVYLCDRPSSLALLHRPWLFDSTEEIPKLQLDLHWVTPTQIAKAPNAKLIYYPDYPEVRLSGVLKGCKLAPRTLMQPVPKAQRRGMDRRVLVIGSAPSGEVYAFISTELQLEEGPTSVDAKGVLRPIVLRLGGPASRLRPQRTTPRSVTRWLRRRKSTHLRFHTGQQSHSLRNALHVAAVLLADEGEPSSMRSAISDTLEVCRRRAAQGGDPTDSDVVVAGGAYFDPTTSTRCDRRSLPSLHRYTTPMMIWRMTQRSGLWSIAICFP